MILLILSINNSLSPLTLLLSLEELTVETNRTSAAGHLKNLCFIFKSYLSSPAVARAAYGKQNSKMVLQIPGPPRCTHTSQSNTNLDVAIKDFGNVIMVPNQLTFKLGR